MDRSRFNILFKIVADYRQSLEKRSSDDQLLPEWFVPGDAGNNFPRPTLAQKNYELYKQTAKSDPGRVQFDPESLQWFVDNDFSEFVAKHGQERALNIYQNRINNAYARAHVYHPHARTSQGYPDAFAPSAMFSYRKNEMPAWRVALKSIPRSLVKSVTDFGETIETLATPGAWKDIRNAFNNGIQGREGVPTTATDKVYDKWESRANNINDKLFYIPESDINSAPYQVVDLLQRATWNIGGSLALANAASKLGKGAGAVSRLTRTSRPAVRAGLQAAAWGDDAGSSMSFVPFMAYELGRSMRPESYKFTDKGRAGVAKPRQYSAPERIKKSMSTFGANSDIFDPSATGGFTY